MTQHQFLQIFLPVLIILPLLYFRMRKLTKARPLKLDRLWIRPALLLAITLMVLLVPPPAGLPIRVLMPLDWAWLGLAGALGAAAGWQWGRTMAIEVHPEDGTLMVRGGQAAILVLAALILFRMGLRTGLAAEARAGNINMLLVSDLSIVFTALLFTLRSVEMYLRAKRVMALKSAS
ncbi:MAG TPA: hypothetical protein VMO78_03040 [Rhizomicrobium sp.]|nr:hypothetical protein [Rhizomicrobium sp.]